MFVRGRDSERYTDWRREEKLDSVTLRPFYIILIHYYRNWVGVEE